MALADGSRAHRAAGGMPGWMGSIRFRLAVVYSSVLFGLAAFMVSLIYLAVAVQLNNEAVYREYPVTKLEQTADGRIRVEQSVIREEFRTFEQSVNTATLAQLRRLTFFALLMLFLTSLGVGWVVAGRALAPIERITAVAREIQATDLTRRIDLGGPPDELRNLADTFDDMLERIDGAFEQQRQFIHEASHELRNPLAVIRTNVDVTLADHDSTDDDYRHTLAVVQRSSERMTRLVDDLLVYARQGTTSRDLHPVEVGALLADAASEFRVSAEERGISVVLTSHLDLWVIGDPVALKQALANLLANAVRLAPEGSTLHLAAGAAEPSWVWMSVTDEGPGIAPADQERVFQRFFRGDGPAGRGEVRSGLGLTIVRQVAEAHGGEVRLVSAVGTGSTFALWLPAARRPEGVRPNGETMVTSSVLDPSPHL